MRTGKKKKTPVRRQTRPDAEEPTTSSSRPGIRKRHCRDCGKITYDITTIRCTHCNTAHQKWWDSVYAVAEKEETKRPARGSFSTSTPRARRSSAPVNGKDRVVLTATGPHADQARRAATKHGVTLSQLAADAIEALPQDLAQPKRPPVLEKGDGSAVLCVYEGNVKRVRELVKSWGWKLAQFTGWLVERLDE